MVQILFKLFAISAMCTLLLIVYTLTEVDSAVFAKEDEITFLSKEADGFKKVPVSSEVVSQGISPIFTNEVDFWEVKILKWAKEWGLDPNMVATVMQIESCGDKTVTSRSGAMGLFQVMPYHFLPEDDPFKPRTNAERGLSYLSSGLAKANGQVDLAFAGYNGGHDVIDWNPKFWPEQTKLYHDFASRIYQDAVNGLQTSEALNEWYDQWGYSMCLRASQVENGSE